MTKGKEKTWPQVPMELRSRLVAGGRKDSLGLEPQRFWNIAI